MQHENSRRISRYGLSFKTKYTRNKNEDNEKIVTSQYTGLPVFIWHASAFQYRKIGNDSIYIQTHKHSH